MRPFFKLFLRVLLRNKIFSAINILGLSVGIACCIIIFLFVRYELSFDNYHKNYDEIYRIVRTTNHSTGTDYSASTPFPMAEALREKIPDIKTVTRLKWMEQKLIKANDNIFHSNDILFVEPEFFEIFDCEWIIGNPNSSLSDIHSVVLTESQAKRYFPDSSCIGKNIVFENTVNFTVTGIVKDPPINNHLPYTMIFPIEALNKCSLDKNFDRWNIILTGMYSYLLTNKEGNIGFVEQKINDIVNEHIDYDTEEEEYHWLQPLNDIHYNTNFANNNVVATTSKTFILIFSLIGLFILIIACINFINLSIAQAIRRSKEVAVRKIVGANRVTLIKHYITESTILTFISVVIAIILIEINIKFINLFIGNNIKLGLYGEIDIVLFLIALILVVSLLTGLYPAFVLSGYHPIKALKDRLFQKQQGTFSVRSLLVIFQFSISQILIIATIFIILQLSFLDKKDLGYNGNDMVTVALPGKNIDDYNYFKSGLLQNSNIQNVCFGMGAPTSNWVLRTEYHLIHKKDEKHNVLFKPVDVEYLNTFKLKLLAGEWAIQSKNDSVSMLVVNETFIKNLGIKNPSEAIGENIIYSGFVGKIMGVVKDFHTQSLHNKIPAVAMSYFPRFFYTASIKINPNNQEQTMAFIKNKWSEIEKENIFEYSFLKDDIDQLYAKDKKTFLLIEVFALIAIFIACLGLFGLVIFIVTQKVKEIGIRKVLGASTSSIVKIVSREFIILVLIASLLSWPVAYYILDKWIQSFEYGISIQLWIFVLSSFITIVLAMLTISIKSINAAMINPSIALKYE